MAQLFLPTTVTKAADTTTREGRYYSRSKSKKTHACDPRVRHSIITSNRKIGMDSTPNELDLQLYTCIESQRSPPYPRSHPPIKIKQTISRQVAFEPVQDSLKNKHRSRPSNHLSGANPSEPPGNPHPLPIRHKCDKIDRAKQASNLLITPREIIKSSPVPGE